ncbi:FUSC family protein [Endozoicomonas acroporae]|uniref:FUSC family protein n=1 Tax=Endozoicomonas acroporae TaxID=1701104 RepID=UPI0011AEEF40|nr:FUSC family protein [Endozoicomonas acroporae]
MGGTITPPAGSHPSSPLNGSSSEPESGKEGTMVTPYGSRKVKASKVDKGDPSVRGEKAPDSVAHPPGERTVKPQQDSLPSLNAVSDKAEDGPGPNLDSTEAGLSKSHLPDRTSVDNNLPNNEESRSFPRTHGSGVKEGFYDDPLEPEYHEEILSPVDEDEIISVTTEFAEEPRNVRTHEMSPRHDTSRLFGPDFGTAVGQIVRENRDPEHSESKLPARIKPLAAHSKTSSMDDESDVASVSIEGGGLDDDPAVRSGGSVTIEGGGDKTSKKLFQRVLGAINKLLNVVKNNPLWAGFVICSAIFLITLMVGQPYAAMFFAICALAFLGVALGVTAYNISKPQNPSQSNSGHNQNPPSPQNPQNQQSSQNSPEDRTQTDPETSTTRTESGSSPHPGPGGRDDRPAITESRRPPVSNGRSEPPVTGGRASNAATQTVEGANTNDLAKNLEKFTQLINENFSPFSSKVHAPEQWKKNSQEPDRKVDRETLEKVSTAAVGLIDQFRHIKDHRDSKGSDIFQYARLSEVEKQTNQLMDLIEPTDAFIEQLTNTVYMQFADPKLSPDPNASPLSIGDTRRRLENFANKDMKGVEFFDLLVEFVRAAKAYRKGRMMYGDKAGPDAESVPLSVKTPMSAPKDDLDDELPE